jgi:UDP-3-O-[3-hydroxymyristoyl] glucosamine N-acyltransferase
VVGTGAVVGPGAVVGTGAVVGRGASVGTGAVEGVGPDVAAGALVSLLKLGRRVISCLSLCQR